MRPFLAARAVLLALAACACQPASAHLMPAQQGTVNLVDDSAYVVVSLPVSALGADTDGDGLASVKEVEQNYFAMQKRVSQGLKFWNGDAPGEVMPPQLLVDAEMQKGENAKHLVAMVRVKFPNAISPGVQVRMETDLFGKVADERQLTLRGRRGTETEPVILTPLNPSHRFFRTPWQVFESSVRLGAEHILLGFDHLLFLLTVLVVGAGWRYWVAVVTSFTVAHSITLTLGALGWAQLPASVAEPLIVASIVAVAWDNLRRADIRLLRRAGFVFTCGLVHGLGFARALKEIGGTRAVNGVQLAGFNVGVELGQLAFVAAALGVIAVVRKLRPAMTSGAVTKVTSWIAGGAGVVLLIQFLAG